MSPFYTHFLLTTIKQRKTGQKWYFWLIKSNNLPFSFYLKDPISTLICSSLWCHMKRSIYSFISVLLGRPGRSPGRACALCARASPSLPLPSGPSLAVPQKSQKINLQCCQCRPSDECIFPVIHHDFFCSACDWRIISDGICLVSLYLCKLPRVTLKKLWKWWLSDLGESCHTLLIVIQVNVTHFCSCLYNCYLL